ncbi:hypothetical protein [Taibaiella koreensis]|uniref:hypothetical protein n=1 Tax=Taibaiella koreensis TaxID=1268548 RepID=UPI000E59DDD5|nr:hypothetical protein [Taibaiella koreensis]
MRNQIFSFLAIVFALTPQLCFCQEETKIWSAAATAIYNRQSHIVYSKVNEPIDPTVSTESIEKIKANDPFIMRIKRKPEKNTQGMAKIITSEMLKKNRTETKFYLPNQETSIIKIDTSNIDFCFEYDDSATETELNKKRSCDKYPTAEISTKLLSMSQIMYSKDKTKAVLWGDFISINYDKQDEIWGMLLRRNRGKWTVVELVFEPSR